MRKLITILLLLVMLPAFADQIKVDRQLGYYIDGTGQVEEYKRIAPPNEDKIPSVPHPTKTVQPFSSYYDRNELGMRRPPYMDPIVPEYNSYYSERVAKPYTRDEYMDVWCTGDKDYKHGVCRTDNINIYFFRARDWSYGVASAAWKNKGSKTPRAIFLMVDDIGLDANSMSDAKKWSMVYGTQMFFGTIDAYIPMDWII